MHVLTKIYNTVRIVDLNTCRSRSRHHSRARSGYYDKINKSIANTNEYNIHIYSSIRTFGRDHGYTTIEGWTGGVSTRALYQCRNGGKCCHDAVQNSVLSKGIRLNRSDILNFYSNQRCAAYVQSCILLLFVFSVMYAVVLSYSLILLLILQLQLLQLLQQLLLLLLLLSHLP